MGNDTDTKRVAILTHKNQPSTRPNQEGIFNTKHTKRESLYRLRHNCGEYPYLTKWCAGIQFAPCCVFDCSMGNRRGIAIESNLTVDTKGIKKCPNARKKFAAVEKDALTTPH
ncbi:MAG: hypothetical protein LBJ00_04730 [Planctomycetaceae bacterium]|nr:hypothetical protein [Planctomycetaceae bacterium]